jgi:exonuclease SbcC
MKIKKVEIQGFRAYKYKQDGTFDFTIDGDKPSNFVAIYAPNGFGKSSFYDAVEWAITNHLDRLGGDYNRINHEQAAKSTKEKGVAQKILRNKDVAKNVTTRVTVSTTLSKPFDRQLKGIRSDSRDIRIGDNKNKENDYFRKVILSQDEIDRFLREAKPQDRYKRFMESFGGDAEVTRQELTALINDNQAVLAELEKKRKGLQEQLLEPVDVSVFERFNSIASEVNADGENIPLVDENFTVNAEHEVLSTLVTRVHELVIQRDARTTLRDSLVERLTRLPEVELNLSLIAEQKPKLDKLSKGVLDSQRYQALLASHSKCLSEIQVVSQQLEELAEVSRLAQDFLNTESEMAAATETQRALSKSRAIEAALLENLEQSAKKQSEDLATVDSRSLFLRSTVENCSPIYSEITMHQVRLLVLGSQIAEKDVTLSLDKAQHDTVKTELAKISELKITAHSLLTSDISAISFDKLKLKELSDFSEKLSGWALHDQAIQKTQDSLAEQMGLHERLIATGLQYLSLWPTSTCPLCHKSHESESVLTEKVESTDLLSSLSKENARKLEASAKFQIELKDKIESIVREALDFQMKRLTELRTKLNDLGTKISETEEDKSKLIASKQAIEAQIKSLQGSVWDLAKEDLISRAEAEIRGLNEKRVGYLSLQTELNERIDAKKALVTEQDLSIKALGLRVDAMTSGSVYQKVGEYLKKNGLSSNELKTHCTEKLAGFERLKEERRADASHIVEQSKALEVVMIGDGTWVDFFTLAPEKEKVEVQIAKSKSLVEAFFDSLSRVIGSQADKTVDEVKDNISREIDAQILQHQELDSKLKKIELLSELLRALKPYLTSLSLRETLADVERDLFQRNRVDSTLTAERNLVIAELKELIKAFFYEDLIDSIYRKIDPHPSLKKVEFLPDFETSDRPGLNIVLSDGAGDSVSPILYFSAAQLNILSLSVFLAGALHAKDDDGNPLDVIMIDDPIQSMDSINVLATIDLLRSISVRFDKQIIISTHDENFFGLLQRKIPSEVLGSKFLKLEKFGVVAPVEPLANQ